MPLDPDVRAFLDDLARTGAPRYGEQPIPEQRRAMLETAARFFGPVGSVATRELVVPGPVSVPVRVYSPASEPAPVLVYLHGGGWVLGSVDAFHGVYATLARLSGCVIVAVEYRLAPEHPFPAPLEDAWTVTTWLAEHAGDVGGFPGQLAVGGDSAGGNMSAVIARRARDAGIDLGLQLLVYPVCDADLETASYREFAEGYWLSREAMRWFWSQYMPRGDWFHPDASPLRAPDLASVAPAHVLTAEYDVLRDEGEAYGRRLQESGVPTTISRHEGMIHGFFRLPAVIPAADRALAEAAEALQVTFGKR